MTPEKIATALDTKRAALAKTEARVLALDATLDRVTKRGENLAKQIERLEKRQTKTLQPLPA